jgi:hypothetical protein
MLVNRCVEEYLRRTNRLNDSKSILLDILLGDMLLSNHSKFFLSDRNGKRILDSISFFHMIEFRESILYIYL